MKWSCSESWGARLISSFVFITVEICTCICVECSLGGKSNTKERSASICFIWVSSKYSMGRKRRLDTKLEISLRKKVLLKKMWEISIYHWQLKSALKFSIPWLCHISGKKGLGTFLSQKFHSQWYGSLSIKFEKNILLKSYSH